MVTSSKHLLVQCQHYMGTRKRCEIDIKMTRRCGFFFLNFEPVPHIFLLCLLVTLSIYLFAGLVCFSLFASKQIPAHSSKKNIFLICFFIKNLSRDKTHPDNWLFKRAFRDCLVPSIIYIDLLILNNWYSRFFFLIVLFLCIAFQLTYII